MTTRSTRSFAKNVVLLQNEHVLQNRTPRKVDEKEPCARNRYHAKKYNGHCLECGGWLNCDCIQSNSICEYCGVLGKFHKGKKMKQPCKRHKMKNDYHRHDKDNDRCHTCWEYVDYCEGVPEDDECENCGWYGEEHTR